MAILSCLQDFFYSLNDCANVHLHRLVTQPGLTIRCEAWLGSYFTIGTIRLATPTKSVSPYMITAATVSPKDHLPVTNPLPLSSLPLVNRTGIWLNLPLFTPTDIPATRKVQKNRYVLLPYLSSETTDGGIGPPMVDVV